MEGDVVCRKSNVKHCLLLKTVKSMLYLLGKVLLRLGNVLLFTYVLIYNLEVSFNFHITFLQLNVIKRFTMQ